MIIKGLDNIIAHLEAEHEKNIDAWFERKNLGPVMERAVRKEYRRRNISQFNRAVERSFEDEDYPGRGIESLFWDIPN